MSHSSGYSPALAHARQVGDDAEFETITNIDALDFAEEPGAHHDAIVTAPLTMDDLPSWARLDGILGVDDGTLAEIKACRIRQSNGERTTPGRWTFKGNEGGQHAHLVAEGAVYILIVYQDTDDGLSIVGAVIITAHDLDRLLTGHWYDVNRHEGTMARLGWPHLINRDTIDGGDAE